jgi:hypothetical protein
MSPFLAQIPNAPATTFKDVLDVLGWLVVIAGVIIASAWYLKNMQRPDGSITPQPLVVKHAEDLAHKEELIELKKSTEDKLDSMRDESKLDRSKLYEKVDEVRKELTNMHEDTRDEMNRGFKDLERAIGRLEGKISNGHNK